MIGFNALVFVTSVCVMTLELTASRLIGKHVGSSLYTWTSVIGVVLAGITLGNWLGGWLADRYNRNRSLAWMYLLGSVSCGNVLWLDQLVGTIPRPDAFSWPAWIVTVVALIFLLPALALGATSPLVASMAIDRSSKTGSTVGNVYAWGALGSIVGTFLTGFYLIDVLGNSIDHRVYRHHAGDPGHHCCGSGKDISRGGGTRLAAASGLAAVAGNPVTIRRWHRWA